MSKAEKKELVPVLRFPEFRKAEEWKKNTFGGIATFFNGRAFKQEELLDAGKYRVLRVGNFFSNNEWYYSDLELEDNKYCELGDLLYAWSASFGPRIWQGEKVIYHYHIWKVIENRGINRQFLFILLDFETEKMKSRSANGLGLMHITKGTIESWKCYLPRIEEQQKIADCLASIDELIAAQAKKFDALKTYKKGLMQQVFPAEGETIPKLRFPEFLEKGEWDFDEFDKLIDVVDGDRGTNYPKAEEFSESGFCLFLSAKNVTKNGFKFEVLQFITKEKDEALRKGKLQREDVVLTTRGSVGQFAYFTEGVPYENMRINSGMVILRVKSKKIVPDYLYAFSKSALLAMQIENVSFGNAQQQLTVAGIKKFPICYPKPDEQQKIADYLTSIDELITAQAQRLDYLKAHKKGLMQQLFPTMDEVGA